MSFVFHQVWKEDNFNHMFPFKIPLSVFSEQGVCMFNSWQKEDFIPLLLVVVVKEQLSILTK